MATFVNQREYLIVDKKVEIGSFGAEPCTILILYDNINKLCAHLDAVTDEVLFKIEINKFINIKDKSKINIILTSSGLYDNEVLRNKIVKYLQELNLNNEPIIIDGTQIVLNSNNEIETEFIPDKKFNLNNFDESLKNKFIKDTEKFKTKVDTFTVSRKNIKGVDEFGRQPIGKNINMCYNYDSASWVQCIQPENNSNLRESMQDFSKPRELKPYFSKPRELKPYFSKQIELTPDFIKPIQFSNIEEKKSKKSKKKPKPRRKKQKFTQPVIKYKQLPFKDMNHRQRKQNGKKTKRKG